MFEIEDLVAAAFNGGSFDLDAIELLEMTNVVSLQVDKLLLQYVAGPDNVRLLPYRPAEMSAWTGATPETCSKAEMA